MKRIFVILFFISTFSSYAQTNYFELNYDTPLGVYYRTGEDNTIKLEFLWDKEESLALTPSKAKKDLIVRKSINKRRLVDFINENSGNRISLERLKKGFKFNNDTTQIKYTIIKSFTQEDIVDYQDDNMLSTLHQSLYGEIVTNDGLPFCGKDAFSLALINNINDLREKIVRDNTKADNSYRNKHIESLQASSYKLNKKKEDSLVHYEDDRRNPITFTRFIVRNPKANGKSSIDPISNYASYHYIRPGSIINIIFDKEAYRNLDNIKIAIKAHLKRKNGTIVPINVSGFYEVEEETNMTEYEKNALVGSGGNETLDYNYFIRSIEATPIQTEINTSIENPQPEDKLIVTISNVSDGSVSFTTTFEYENSGWEQSASGGFSWINSSGQSSNFRPAGASGVSFYYKRNKGDSFLKHLLIPSFGPELVVLEGEDDSVTNVGLGASISLFLRTFKVGVGWFLTGKNGKLYTSIGVNFVEGYKSLAAILERSRE